MHKTTNRKLSAALKMGAGLNMLLAFCGTAVAQEAETSEQEMRMDTMMVTATKREQTLQDVPIAVSVVSAQEIVRSEIQDAFDLQTLVPALEVQPSTTTANVGFSIRGFGGVSSNAGIEPSVGVVIDGVYRSRASAQISDLVNIERVEVLRGPQSTLFGRNASVGVVSILTQEPEFEFGGNASFTYGNFDTVRLRGNVTGPITDTLAFRVAGSYNRRDGFAENLETGTGLNDRDRWSIQGQLLFEPTSDLSVRLIGDYDEIDETCCFTTNIVSGPVTEGVVAALGDVVLEDPFSFEAFANFDPINRVENGGVSLHVTKGFADIIDVTSITAFRVSDTFTFTDADATSADIVTSLNIGETETFTQEIRLTSTYEDSPVDWMIGGFYFNEELEFPGEFLFGEDFRGFADGLSGGALTGAEAALGLPIGTSFGQAGQGVIEDRGQDNTSWSIFATLDWHVTEALTLSGGISYIEDEKDAFFSQVNTDAFSSLDFVAIGFGQALAGLGVDPTDPAAVAAFAGAFPDTFAAIQIGSQDPAINPLLGLQALQFLPPFLDFPNIVESGETNDSDVTYNARIAYDVTNWLNVYGSYATGFKASSFNLSRDSRPFPSDFIPGSPVTSPPPSPIRDAGLDVPNLTTGTRFAEPEETEVFEIGAKLQLSNLFVALTLFDQTVEGFQSNIFTGLGFALSNAGEQSTRGIEIDTQWVATEDLTLSFYGAFYDAEFDSFPNSPAGDLTGETPAGVPEVQTTVAANYDFRIAGMDGFARADWQYTGPTAFSDSPAIQGLIGFEEDSHLVNASIGLELPTGTLLTIWGRNIFDEQFIAGAFPAIAQAGSISGFPNQPATYGFTLRQEF